MPGKARRRRCASPASRVLQKFAADAFREGPPRPSRRAGGRRAERSGISPPPPGNRRSLTPNTKGFTGPAQAPVRPIHRKPGGWPGAGAPAEPVPDRLAAIGARAERRANWGGGSTGRATAPRARARPPGNSVTRCSKLYASQTQVFASQIQVTNNLQQISILQY